MTPQEIMEAEYNKISGMRGMDYKAPFKVRLKEAFESGLLIFVKWSLALILAYLALTFGTQLVTGSVNGTQSAIYLNELQNKGYLPKVVNGTVPVKETIKN